MDVAVCLYALMLSQLLNPEFNDFLMKGVFRVFKLNYSYIVKPHFDGNYSGELLYSPDFSEAASERIICDQNILLEFGYKLGMPKDCKYPIRAVNLKTKRTAESIIDKRKWDCYYNLFSCVEKKRVALLLKGNGKVWKMNVWKMNMCVHDLINFVIVFDMPHLYKMEVFPEFTQYLSKPCVDILNMFLAFFASMLKVRHVIIMNAILLACFFLRFLKREVLWRYFCTELACLTMSIQDLVHSKFGSSVYKKMSFLHTCCSDERKIKRSKDVSRKFLATSWKSHLFYRTNDRISIPICVASLEKHQLDSPLPHNSEFLFNLRGVTINVMIVDITSFKYKVEVDETNYLGQKLKWEGHVKVPNFHCLLDALRWQEKKDTYHIRTFQPYREVMHAQGIIENMRDVNEQDFRGFGVMIINKNSSFYIK